MKKLMIAVSAAALCGAVFADEATTPESPIASQTVGFNTITVERGGYYLAAPQFMDCQEKEGDVQDLAKIITTDVTCVDMEDTSWEADGYCATIMVKTSEYDPNYDFFYYCYDSDTGDPLPATPGWWKDDLETPLTDKLALGRGAWIVIPNDEEKFPEASYTFTFAGATMDLTKQGASVPLLNNAYTIAANSFPAGLTGANITFSPGVVCKDMEETSWEADGYCVTVMVKTSQQDPNYEFYYYCYDSDTSDPLPATAGWWKDDLETPWTTPIPAGTAFWIVIPDGLLPDNMQTMTFTF